MADKVWTALVGIVIQKVVTRQGKPYGLSVVE